MELVNKIIQNELYQSCIKKTEELEKDRMYCKHNMQHFMDVARIAYILNLEYKLSISKEIIYACAILHDVGKHEQYLYHIPHEVAGSKIAAEILAQCGCVEDDISKIVKAIALHRRLEADEALNLNSIIYKADKMSRSCYSCKASDSCDWDMSKKNMVIKI